MTPKKTATRTTTKRRVRGTGRRSFELLCGPGAFVVFPVSSSAIGRESERAQGYANRRSRPESVTVVLAADTPPLPPPFPTALVG